MQSFTPRSSGRPATGSLKKSHSLTSVTECKNDDWEEFLAAAGGPETAPGAPRRGQLMHPDEDPRMPLFSKRSESKKDEGYQAPVTVHTLQYLLYDVQQRSAKDRTNDNVEPSRNSIAQSSGNKELPPTTTPSCSVNPNERCSTTGTSRPATGGPRYCARPPSSSLGNHRPRDNISIQKFIKQLPAHCQNPESFVSTLLRFTRTSSGTPPSRSTQLHDEIPPSAQDVYDWKADTATTFSVRVPPKYWVTTDQPVRAADEETGDVQLISFPSPLVPIEGLLGTDCVVFPSVSQPNSRMEVFYLAKALDTMLHDQPELLATLQNVQTCYAMEGRQEAGNYLDAASKFLEILDIGFAEVARHCASGCLERGVLLQRLRTMMKDVVTNSFDIASFARNRAEKALQEQRATETALRDANEDLTAANSRIESLESEMASLREEYNALKYEKECREFDENREKVSKTLVQFGKVRQTAIRKMTEVSDRPSTAGNESESNQSSPQSVAQEHLSASQNSRLGGSMLGSSAGGDGVTIGSSLDTRKDGSPLDIRSDQQGKRPSTSSGLDGGMEDMLQQEQVYHSIISLVQQMKYAADATDVACKLFYSKMLFPQPSLNVRIARDKWQLIARAVGREEVELDKRKARLERRRMDNLRLGGRGGTPMADGSDEDDDADDIGLLLERAMHQPSSYTLSTSQINAVLSNTQATLREIAMRIEALGHSPLLKKCLEPDPIPPSAPSEPCVLCHRVEPIQISEEKKRAEIVELSNSLTIASQTIEKLQKTLERRNREIERMREQEKMTQAQLRELEAAGAGASGDTNSLGTGNKSNIPQVTIVEPREVKTTPKGGPSSPLRVTFSDDYSSRQRSSVTPKDSSLTTEPNSASSPGGHRRTSSVSSVDTAPPRPSSPPLRIELRINCHCTSRGIGGGGGSSPTDAGRLKARRTSGGEPSAYVSNSEEEGNTAATSVSPSKGRGGEKMRKEEGENEEDLIYEDRGESVTEQPQSSVVASEANKGVVDEFPPVTLQGLSTGSEQMKRNLKDIIKIHFSAYKEPPAKRGMSWLLRIMYAVYKGKLQADMTAEFERMSPVSMKEYFARFMKNHYGTKRLVDSTAVAYFNAMAEFCGKDLRVLMFSRFYTQYFSTKLLTFFLRFSRLLDEATRGPTYGTQVGLPDDAAEPQCVSLMNAHYACTVALSNRSFFEMCLRSFEAHSFEVSDTEFQQGLWDARLAKGLAPSDGGLPPLSKMIPKEWPAEDIGAARRKVLKIECLAIVCHYVHLEEVHEQLRQTLSGSSF